MVFNEDNLGIARKRLVEKIILSNWLVKSPIDRTYTYNELLFVIQEMMQSEGKNYLELNSANRGYEIFRNFVELLLYRNLANYDSMILLTSPKGTGKSSAAIMIARYWCKLLGRNFDPEKNIAYNNNDVSNKIDELAPFSALICDEAVRFALSSEWAKKEHRELRKKLAQVRTKHFLFILCFPLKVYKLESTYLQSYVNYWVDLYARGRSVIYIKNANPTQDGWALKEFDKVVGSYNEFTSEEQIKQKLMKHPNYWQMMKIPKVPEHVYEKYMKTRERNVYDSEDGNLLASTSKEEIYRALLILALKDIMTNDTTLSMNRIILHIKNQYDITINKSIVQFILEDSKQLISKVREQVFDGNIDEKYQTENKPTGKINE